MYHCNDLPHLTLQHILDQLPALRNLKICHVVMTIKLTPEETRNISRRTTTVSLDKLLLDSIGALLTDTTIIRRVAPPGREHLNLVEQFLVTPSSDVLLQYMLGSALEGPLKLAMGIYIPPTVSRVPMPWKRFALFRRRRRMLGCFEAYLLLDFQLVLHRARCPPKHSNKKQRTAPKATRDSVKFLEETKSTGINFPFFCRDPHIFLEQVRHFCYAPCIVSASKDTYEPASNPCCIV